MNNTIWAQVVEIEKKSSREEKSLSLKGFILHPMNYNTSRVFTVVFTVVFTARSLRVHPDSRFAHVAHGSLVLSTPKRGNAAICTRSGGGAETNLLLRGL